jgi:coenzyme F420 hydrogenase subunit beta
MPHNSYIPLRSNNDCKINKKAKFPWHIVSDGLCVRCGACVSLCPKSILMFDEKYYPLLVDKNECNFCGYCMTACPGMDVDIPEISKEVFGEINNYFNVLGIHREVLIGRSSNENIRKASSAGGIITQILITLLKEGYIRKALVAGISLSEPWKGKAMLAETEQEIIECTQSKYTIIPQMNKIGEIINTNEDIAVVGLPCHIHALRKYQSRFPHRLKNVKVIIGLFCHMAIEIDGTLRMIERAKIKKENIEKIEYRGGEWPGQVRVVMKDGKICSLHSSDFKDGAINYLKYLYYPKRCLTCIDFSAELSDISVGDPWFRNKDGSYIYKGGHSLILIRTEKGKSVVSIAAKTGHIKTEKINEKLLVPRFKGMRQYKKVGAHIRIEKLIKKRLPYPNYHYNLSAPKYSDWVKEIFHSMTRCLGKTKKGRNLGSFIAFSKIGDKLNIARRLRKEFLARYQYK